MGRMRSGTVTVKGLDDLRRELRKLDEPGLIDGLKDANFAAAQLVVSAAQSQAGRYPKRGTKAGSGRSMEQAAAETLRAARQAARAQVSFGGPKFPFAGGAEFGGSQHQFRPWRGNGRDAGYWLYPAIRDETDRIVDLYGDALEALTQRAFPD